MNLRLCAIAVLRTVRGGLLSPDRWLVTAWALGHYGPGAGMETWFPRQDPAALDEMARSRDRFAAGPADGTG